jgi:glycosyltransferase involved in cell wall biosynthesis
MLRTFRSGLSTRATLLIMSKTIFFDGLNLGLKQGTGVATYTRVLANSARELGHSTGILYNRQRQVPKNALAAEVVFFDEEPPPKLPGLVSKTLAGIEYIGGFAGTRLRPVPATGAVIIRPLSTRWVPCDYLYAAPNIFNRAAVFFYVLNRLYRVSLPLKHDLFHWTYPMPLRSNATANIYTIHDLVPLRLPYTTLDKKRFYLRMMRKLVRKADHIVTVSEHSKRDIMKYLGVEEARITNTFQAVDIPDQFRLRPPDRVASDVGGIFGLDMKKYFVFYGALEPKKNVGRLIQAYLAANVDMPLVVISSASWASEREGKLLDQIISDDDREHKERLQRKIRRYDYLSFPLLMSLVRGARAVLFPSLYEGFGLPVLEAMTLGTPVITSTESSLPEVAGDAALCVNPYDTDAIRKAITILASDEAVCAELSRRGIAQAEKFSPKAYAERLSALYGAMT